MTNQILKTEPGVSVSHCVIVQCPPLAKCPHLKITEQKFSEKFRLKPKKRSPKNLRSSVKFLEKVTT